MKMYRSYLLFLLITLTSTLLCEKNEEAIQRLIRAVPLAEKMKKEFLMLFSESDKSNEVRVVSNQGTVPPLFMYFPELARSVSFTSLGSFPTPIYYLAEMSKELPSISLYCKQDGLSGGLDEQGNRLFGGNKVRKLEFLLADALRQDARVVLTFGCVGSNHAVATAAYAKKLGLGCICMLKRQPNSYVARRNLALMDYYGAKLKYYPTVSLRAAGTISTVVDYKQEQGEIPYIIPTGGSWPLGIIGFVNAAFELKEQIDAGFMPEPDYIYVAAGSLGTATGLILGCKAAGLKSRVIAVAVEVASIDYFEENIRRLFYETNKMLHEAAPAFPLFELEQDDIKISYTSMGQGYALFTQDAIGAMQQLKETEHIIIDGTYAGKAFDGLLKDYCAGKLANSVVLFWNTYCADEYAHILQSYNYYHLPRALRAYFIQDVQPLDDGSFI